MTNHNLELQFEMDYIDKQDFDRNQSEAIADARIELKEENYGVYRQGLCEKCIRAQTDSCWEKKEVSDSDEL